MIFVAASALLIFTAVVILISRWSSIYRMIMENFAIHARKPGGGFWGFMLQMGLKENNPVEEAAFKELGAQPSHNILEIGFGFGHGISYALKSGMREGSGVIYGVDYSEKACDYVKGILKSDVDSGKLVIYCEDVATLPLEDNSVDRIFHTNCFYFWPDHLAVCKELKRVLVPGGIMVTGLQPQRVKMGVAQGIVPKIGSDICAYVQALTDAGFDDVLQKEVPMAGRNRDILLITAKKI